MQLRVELDKTFLERLRTSPRNAITELIWNALDADADAIDVELETNAMDGVTSITVRDDGHGMTEQDVQSSFSRLGGSWKAGASSTRGKHRALHGREGRGRFLAAKIAGKARWTSVYEADDGQRHRLVVEIRRTSLDNVEVRDEGSTRDRRGIPPAPWWCFRISTRPQRGWAEPPRQML